MATTDPSLVLIDARARGVSWRVIVEALRVLTSAGSLDAENRPWVEIAANLSGYTVVQLRQAQRTYKFIEKLITEKDLPSHALDWPMSILEVICRIAKIESQKAEKLLISTTQKSWRDLLKLYETMRDEPGSAVSAMSAGHRSARTFTTVLSNALSQSNAIEELLGAERTIPNEALKSWPGRYLFAHPDFVVRFHESGELRIAAFEGLRFYGEINLQAAANAASKAAVQATFFARYYWCLSTRLPVDNLMNMRDQLGLLNVGIVLVEGDYLELLSEPTGEPQPNRQGMLLRDTKTLKRLDFKL